MKKHIIYLHQYFVFPEAAGGTRSYDLARQFVQHGYDVTIVTSSAFMKNKEAFRDRWTIVEKDGLKVHVLKADYSNKFSFLQRIGSFVRFLYHASMHVMRMKGDVVLATSTPITIAVPALASRLFRKTPFIFEVRDVWPEAPAAMGVIRNPALLQVLGRFEKHIYNRAAHIVALSTDMESSILRRTRTGREKITVIPNIAELNRFSATAEDDSLLRQLIGFKPLRTLLYAGTLGRVNGLSYLVSLAAHTATLDPDLVYVIIGDGMEKETLQRQAADAGVLDKTVFFLAPIPKSRLPQLYRECSVASSFVIPVPGLWANSANKFFDSLAAARPIVINHLGWQSEVIRRYNAGYVLDHDTGRMAETAKDFTAYINNTSLLREQSLNAHRAAEDNYSLEIATDRYLKVLDHVV